MLSERGDAALALLRAEYLETPTLLLTVGQAAELLDLTRTAAVAVLQALENSVFWRSHPMAALAGRLTGGEQLPWHRRQQKWPERLHPVCQEEFCNPGLDVSINLNSNSILTHQCPSVAPQGSWAVV